MNSIKSIHNIGAFYFFLLALLYIVAALVFRNGYFADWSIFLMRILDVPFAMVALIYGGTSLYLQINEEGDESGSPWNLVIFAVSVLLFGLVVFVNFAFPSVL